MSLPCPQCGSGNTEVLDTRRKVDEEGVPYVWRRRKCVKCQERFSSIENREIDLASNEG
jgi:transcriptional regulator NrdR family protein